MKKFLSILLCTMLVLSLCATAFADDAKPSWVRDDPSSIGKTVVVYSTLDDPQQATVEGIWYEYYPDCTIEWVNDSVGKLIARARGEMQRKKVIVPDSAHGTNPASAAVCGLEIIEVKSDGRGLVDLADLERLVSQEGPTIAAMMMTNPNTLGLFETRIPEIARLIHDCGALMYYDGANLNPMLGACRPGDMGFDVMHINLHKTFSTPHGGGGPGSGPVGVREGLQEYFPYVSPYNGNFSVILRACAYVMSLGREQIKLVGPLATLNANYIKESLKDLYELPIDGLCCHEFVFDGLKDKSTGVTTMDIAKRLLDYGYHAPTIYFPLLFHESLMIEPTENESRETLDGFIAVMRKIAEEAKTDPDLVKSAPHNTPIGRVDDVLAAKHPVVKYKDIVSL